MKRMLLSSIIIVTTIVACSKKVPPKAVFTLDWTTKTARYRVIGEGENKTSQGIYRQDPNEIKKNVIIRLGNKGYKLIENPDSRTSTDGILKLHYQESVSSVSHWGDTQYHISTSLQDSAGNIILNLGPSRTVWEWTDSTLFDYRYLPELVDLAWQKKDLFEFYNQFLVKQRYLTRIVKILSNSKDSRAIDVLVPLLRYERDALRANARNALVKLYFTPQTIHDKAAMEMVSLLHQGGDIARGKKVIEKYGMVAIELYLEDLKIQPGPRYHENIPELARYALGAITTKKNKTWNQLIINRMIDILESGGEGAKTHKESYMRDAIEVLGRAGDRRVIKHIEEYQDHPALGETAKNAIRRIERNY